MPPPALSVAARGSWWHTAMAEPGLRDTECDSGHMPKAALKKKVFEDQSHVAAVSHYKQHANMHTGEDEHSSVFTLEECKNKNNRTVHRSEYLLTTTADCFAVIDGKLNIQKLFKACTELRSIKAPNKQYR